jgi:hypothetical protein
MTRRDLPAATTLGLVEGVPTRLAEMLLQGERDLAVMAQPERFHERLDVLLSTTSASASPFRSDIG